MEKSLNWQEFVITRLIKASGYSAILFVALIFFFLVREGIPTFWEADFLPSSASAGIPSKNTMEFCRSLPAP